MLAPNMQTKYQANERTASPGVCPRLFSPNPSFLHCVRVFAVVRVWVLGLPRSGGAGTAPSIRKPARLEVGPPSTRPKGGAALPIDWLHGPCQYGKQTTFQRG